MNTGTVQIMWKEIIVGFIILYLLRRVLDAYMIKKYEKLLKLFGVIEMDTLKLEAEKHLKLCNFSQLGRGIRLYIGHIMDFVGYWQQ